MIKETKFYILNPEDFVDAIQKGEEVYIQFRRISPDIESIVIKMIHRILEKYDIMYVKDTIINVVKELMNNAIKANLKRLYFKNKGMDINSVEEYRRGMESFKADTYESEESDYFEQLEDSKFLVRVAFKTRDGKININVINNVPIMDSELTKITSRIKKVYRYKDIAEAFDDVIDDSEGAGLGLIMSLMLFKNSGLPAESFRILKKDKMTVSAIIIPTTISQGESAIKVADVILKEIEDIPAFPANIIQLQRLCSNPESSMKEIADNISLDPGLTASLLKLANSAGYVTVKRVEFIEEAVKIIGMKGINTLLLATGVHKIIDSRYKRFETMWNNSYKRAFYAQKISFQLKKNKISDFAYLAALLADIGSIVMLAINQDLMDKLREIAGNKGIEDPDLLEEISLGLSHSTLGGMICRKWKFNEALVKAIEFHHRPHMAPENLRDIIYTIYLADAFGDIERNKTRFEIIDEDVLKHFGLEDKKSFLSLHETLKENYTTQQNVQKNISHSK